MPILPADGSVTYNGVTFPVYAKTRVRMQPREDRAMRRTMYIDYFVEVEAYFTVGEGDTEDQMLEIQKKLTARGGALSIVGKGFGLSVNQLQGPRDVAMGPHPEIISCQPVGNRRAWLVAWSCKTALPKCSDGEAVTAGRPMAFNYTWAVRQDDKGFSTRTVSGELVIPMTLKAGERVPPDVADAYWDQMMAGIPPIPSFKRSVDRTLSEDRRTLGFTVTDQEMPADAFVPGATNWDGTQTVSMSLRDGGGARWMNTLTATYEVARGERKQVIYERFLALLASRIDQAQKQFMMVGMNVSDHVSAQDVTFTAQWVVMTQDARQGLLASGIFQPITGGGWPEWAASVATSALAPRGNAKLAYDPKSDSVIDLCDPPNFGLKAGAGADRTLSTSPERGLRTVGPLPERSFALFTCAIEFTSDEGAFSLRTLPDVAAAGAAGGQDGFNLRADAERPVDGVQRPDDPFAPPPDGGVQGQQAKLLSDLIPAFGDERNPIQKRANRSPVVRVRGSAVRFGFPIVPPRLVACAGLPATLQRPRFATAVVGNTGIPIVAARWDDTYILPGAASDDLPIPGNPLFT